MATLKQRFAKQTKAVLPMTWGKPQVPGVVPLMATNKGNVAETPIPGEELLTSFESGTVRSPVQFSKGHIEPPLLDILSDKISVANRLPKRYLEPPLSDKVSSSELLQPTSRSLPASFTAKQVSDDHWSVFPDAHSLSSHFANIDFHSIGDYFKSIPQELFYFLNSHKPSECIGIVYNSVKHFSRRTMLDFGSNVFLITDVEATRIGIPILRHSIALNTANGSSTILGVTPPLLISYGCIDRGLQSSHCMLVIKSTLSTCFDLLIGNPDCAEFRAIHDTGLGTLTLSRLCPSAYHEPPVVLPVFSATPSSFTS